MLEQYLEYYIDTLYRKQNNTACLEQKNLFSKKDYYELLKPVIQMLQNQKDLTIEEMREYLFKKSGIEEVIKDVIQNQALTPGLVLSYGTMNYQETLISGNRQEVSLDQNNNVVTDIKKMNEDTSIDLASITKLFTSLSILYLMEEKEINLEDKITKYLPEFQNLSQVSIYDLMAFQVPLETTSGIENAPSKEEAEQILKNIKIKQEEHTLRPYTDMGAMVLKYIVEKVSNKNLYDFIKDTILEPLYMNSTFVIPENLDNVVSTNLASQLNNEGKFITIASAIPGIVYDAKARIMGQPEGILSGHAGMFSNAKDMTTLAKSIIDGKVLIKNTIEMMSKNRTGEKVIINEVKKYRQYLGMLCYSKHPNLSDSEVFHPLSGRAFASAGWTGTQLTIDPLNECYLFLGSNRSHNRIIFVDGTKKDQIKRDEKGKEFIVMPDGTEKAIAQKFAWKKDIIIHTALKLTLQYKMLEDILSYQKGSGEKEYVKTI